MYWLKELTQNFFFENTNICGRSSFHVIAFERFPQLRRTEYLPFILTTKGRFTQVPSSCRKNDLVDPLTQCRHMQYGSAIVNQSGKVFQTNHKKVQEADILNCVVQLILCDSCHGLLFLSMPTGKTMSE